VKTVGPDGLRDRINVSYEAEEVDAKWVEWRGPIDRVFGAYQFLPSQADPRGAVVTCYGRVAR
jgi:hypothetical protein